jgi:hypothetical protein
MSAVIGGGGGCHSKLPPGDHDDGDHDFGLLLCGSYCAVQLLGAAASLRHTTKSMKAALLLCRFTLA